MPAAFDVIDRTDSGKAKVRYAGIGTTGYRDLEAGEPTSQQAYAAAVGNEKSDYTRDDDGRITGREIEDDDERPTEEEAEEVTQDERDIIADSFPTDFRSQRLWVERSPTGQTPVESEMWMVRIWKHDDTPETVDPETMDQLEQTAVRAIKNGVGGQGGLEPLAREVDNEDPDGEEDRERIDHDEVPNGMLGVPEGYVKIEKRYGTYIYEILFASESLREAAGVPGVGLPE